MTNREFSDQFDVLYNNITSNQAPGLNEYEKSVFLTKAQDEIVKNHFNPKSNKNQEGFDDSAKRQTDFSMLLKTSTETINSDSFNITDITNKIDPRAVLVTFPNDFFLAINESIVDNTRTKIRQVFPLTFQEYSRLMTKPYKEPLKYQAWRLASNTNSHSSVSNIILNSTDRKTLGPQGVTYILRYIKRPIPIILENFETAFGENISINGYNGSEAIYNNGYCCELDPAIHEEVLQRAVEAAKVAWAGDMNALLQTGQRSE